MSNVRRLARGQRHAQVHARCSCERHGLRNSEVRERGGSPSSVRAARPTASGGLPRYAYGWPSWRSLPAPPELCSVLCSCVALARQGCVPRRGARTSCATRRPCVSAPPCGVRSPRAAPAFGSCLTRFASLRASRRSALVVRFVGLEAFCLSRGTAWQTGAHGSQATRAPSTA